MIKLMKLSIVLISVFGLNAMATDRLCGVLLEDESAQTYLRITKHLVETGELSLEELRWMSLANKAVSPRRLKGEPQEVAPAFEAYSLLTSALVASASTWPAVRSQLAELVKKRQQEEQESKNSQYDTRKVFAPHTIGKKKYSKEGTISSIVTQNGELFTAHYSKGTIRSSPLTVTLGDQPDFKFPIEYLTKGGREVYETRSGRLIVTVAVFKPSPMETKTVLIYEYRNNKLTTLGSVDIEMGPSALSDVVSTIAENSLGELLLLVSDPSNPQLLTFNINDRNKDQILKLPRVAKQPAQVINPQSGRPLIEVMTYNHIVNSKEDQMTINLFDIDTLEPLLRLPIPSWRPGDNTLDQHYDSETQKFLLPLRSSDFYTDPKDHIINLRFINILDPKQKVDPLSYSRSPTGREEVIATKDGELYLLVVDYNKSEIRQLTKNSNEGPWTIPHTFMRHASSQPKAVAIETDEYKWIVLILGGHILEAFDTKNKVWLQAPLELNSAVDNFSKIEFVPNYKGTPALAIFDLDGKEIIFLSLTRTMDVPP